MICPASQLRREADGIDCLVLLASILFLQMIDRGVSGPLLHGPQICFVRLSPFRVSRAQPRGHTTTERRARDRQLEPFQARGAQWSRLPQLIFVFDNLPYLSLEIMRAGIYSLFCSRTLTESASAHVYPLPEQRNLATLYPLSLLTHIHSQNHQRGSHPGQRSCKRIHRAPHSPVKSVAQPMTCQQHSFSPRSARITG